MKARPRFRIFAGPNGSGKTHLFKFLRSSSFIHTEIYVNADAIEKTLLLTRKFHFNAYRVKVSDTDFKSHILQSGILQKMDNHSFVQHLNVTGGVLYVGLKKNHLNSYIASLIATYLAEKLIETKQSFCYETVLSHPSKLKLLQLANAKGYKTYLYFVFTDNWRLNIERVKLRVKQGGHDVDAAKVEERYFRSLKLFSRAAALADSAYLIDNSSNFNMLAELKSGQNVFKASNYPQWLKKYYNPK